MPLKLNAILSAEKLLKISRSQRNIILSAVLLIGVFLIAGIFLYAPLQAKLARLKNELEETKSSIQKIQAMVPAQGGGIGEGIKLLDGQYRQLSGKFPAKEEAALSVLFDLAHQANIEITTVQSQPKNLCAQQAAVKDKQCYELPVSLSLKGNYENLVEYIELLRGSLPAVITFEKLMAQKTSPGAPELTITIEIKLYLLA